MKLLVALSRFPFPLEKGDQLRAFHQIKELSCFYEIHLFCLCSGENVSPLYIKELEPYCASICISPVKGGLARLWQGLKFRRQGLPLQCAYFFGKRAKRRWDAYVAQVAPDVVLCQLLRMVPYVQEGPFLRVLDYQDVFSFGMYKRFQLEKGLKAAIWKYEYRALERMEKKAFEEFTLCTIISEQDRGNLPLHVEEKERVMVWPNGVDSDFFHKVEVENKENFDVVFTGNMGYSPNEDAAEFLVQRVLPRLNNTGESYGVRDKNLLGLSNLRVLIAGTSPTHLVRRLASEQVTVSGYLKDIRMAYAMGKVFVAPMRLGTGMQNKLLEAMACELPCIASEIAVKGLGPTVSECPVFSVPLSFDADEVPEEMVQKIREWLNKPEECKKLGLQGRNFVIKYYSWSAQATAFRNWIDGSVFS